MWKTVLAITLAFFGSSALAQHVSISASGYNTQASQNVGVSSEEVVRQAAATSLFGAYRMTHGWSSLPVGTLVTITYSDGTSETFVVVSTMSSVQGEVVPNTQRDANGNLINPGNSSSGGGGVFNPGPIPGGGSTPWPGCVGDCGGPIGVVTVG